MSEPFPWERMMELGLGVLRLSPAEFWKATPREIAAAFGAPRVSLTRENLQQMMVRYPDVGSQVSGVRCQGDWRCLNGK